MQQGLGCDFWRIPVKHLRGKSGLWRRRLQLLLLLLWCSHLNSLQGLQVQGSSQVGQPGRGRLPGCRSGHGEVVVRAHRRTGAGNAQRLGLVPHPGMVMVMIGGDSPGLLARNSWLWLLQRASGNSGTHGGCSSGDISTASSLVQMRLAGVFPGH